MDLNLERYRFLKYVKMNLSKEFKKMLINYNVDPNNVVDMVTFNNKKTRKIITFFKLKNGQELSYEKDFLYFAHRPNDRDI